MRTLKVLGLSMVLGALVLGTAAVASGAGSVGNSTPSKTAVVQEKVEKDASEASEAKEKADKEDEALPGGGHADKDGANVNHEFEGVE